MTKKSGIGLHMGFIMGHWEHSESMWNHDAQTYGSLTVDFKRGRIIGMRLALKQPTEYWTFQDKNTEVVYSFQRTPQCKRKAGSRIPRLSDGRDDRYLMQYVKRHQFLSTQIFCQQWHQACKNTTSIRHCCQPTWGHTTLHFTFPLVMVLDTMLFDTVVSAVSWLDLVSVEDCDVVRRIQILYGLP